MLRFGHRLSDMELRELISSVDINHDGEIDFQEFITLMEIKGVKYDPDAELRLAFNTIDADGNGTISVMELKNLMEKTNQRVSDADFDALMSSIDKNKDGVLDFEEFKELMVGSALSTIVNTHTQIFPFHSMCLHIIIIYILYSHFKGYCNTNYISISIFQLYHFYSLKFSTLKISLSAC